MLSIRSLLALCALTTAAALCLSFLPVATEHLAYRFTQVLPAALLAQVLLTLASAAAVWRVGGLRAPRGDLATAAVAAVVLTAVIVMAIPAEFRILADETNLISTSLGLFRSGRADNITMAQTYYDTFHVVASEAAARPLLFPALMTLLHWLCGYNPYHGMTVNIFCMAGALFGVTLTGCRLGGRALGVFAAVMMAALPLFQLYGRASGFEPVNLAVLGALLLAMLAFAHKPTLTHFELAAWLGLLAGQCRYESIVMLVPVALLGARHWRTVLAGPGSWRLAGLPLCLVPLMWQRQQTSVINAGDTIASPFGAQYIWPHLVSAREFFLDPEPGKYPVVQMTTVLAGFGLAMVAYQLWRRTAGADAGRPAGAEGPRALTRLARLAALPRTDATLLGLGLFVAGIVAIFVTHLAYYLADFRAPIIGRYALSYLVPLCLLAAYPLADAWRQASLRLWVAALAGGAFCYGISVSSVNDYGRQLLLFREYRQNLATLAEFKPESTLVISDRPGMYAAHLYGAVNFEWVKTNLDSFAHNIERHLFDHVLVLQTVHYGNTSASPAVPDRLRLKTLREYQNSADYYYRISEVEGTEPERGPPRNNAH